MTEIEAVFESLRYGTTPFVYPREEHDPNVKQADRKNNIAIAEWTVKLIYSGRTDRVQHMHASIGIAILKNDLNLREIADHFGITQERVAQVVKKVKSFGISARS
jgi:DNA-directed RNA polymerase specialized sigma subunit